MIHVALYQPDIPQNTGNIARTMAVVGGTLHLIKPLGFSLMDAKLKRAGLDYWSELSLIVHDSFEDFLASTELPIYLVTTKGEIVYSHVEYEEECIFLFGSESKGVPEEVHQKFLKQRITIPMLENPAIRSMNLSNSVAIVVFEAWRQRSFL